MLRKVKFSLTKILLNKGALAYFTREIAMKTVLHLNRNETVLKKLYCCVGEEVNTAEYLALTICLLVG